MPEALYEQIQQAALKMVWLRRQKLTIHTLKHQAEYVLGHRLSVAAAGICAV